MFGLRRQYAALVVVAGIAMGCDAGGTEEFTGADAAFEKSGNAPTNMASGGGTVDVTNGRSVYTFHATTNGNSEVKGSFQLHFTSVDANVTGDVTCLLVTGGNYARLSGTVTASSDETLVPVGRVYHWQVVDNGEGNAAAPDLITAFYTVADPAVCNFNDLPDNTWTNGNVQVR